MVQAGLRAQLAEQSFVTGQLRVDLDFRRNEPARLVGALSDVPEIPAVSSPLAQLKDQLEHLPLRQLVDSAQRTFASVDRLSRHLDARLDPLADSVQRTADTATQTLQTTGVAVRQIQGQAITTLRDIDSLSVDARHQLDARSGEAGRTLTDADAAIRQARTLLDSLNDMMDSRSQFRGDLASATHDLAASASSLRGFAETVERHPNALLLGRRTSP
jgi:paraquat-inducible protein B